MARPDDDTAEHPALEVFWLRRAGLPSSAVEVDLAGLTHPGSVRENNEDHFLIARFDRAMHLIATNVPAGDVPPESTETAWGMLVADGVGGAAGGEVASRTAITELVELALETPDWIMRFDPANAAEVGKRMERRFRKIREILVERVKGDPSLKGMATTLTLAVSLGADLVTAHVGDSRVYVLHEGQLRRLTADQTMAQTLADAGAISPEDVAKHPSRHILTGAIATRGAFLNVELKHSRLSDGDQLLLCTDGLTEMASEEKIAAVLSSRGSAADACRKLVDLALEGGGKDNVTVVVARYRLPGAASAAR